MKRSSSLFFFTFAIFDLPLSKCSPGANFAGYSSRLWDGANGVGAERTPSTLLKMIGCGKQRKCGIKLLVLKFKVKNWKKILRRCCLPTFIFLLSLTLTLQSLLPFLMRIALAQELSSLSELTTTEVSISSASLKNQGDNLVLKDEALTSAFPELEQGFKDLSLELESNSEVLKSENIDYTINVKQDQESQAEYVLDSGLKITTQYQKENLNNPKIVSLSQSKPTKQLITIDNPLEANFSLTLNINHTINAETFFWDGKEYQITKDPQILKAYEGKATIDPQDELYDEALEGLPEEERDFLPNISIPSYLGTSISFKTEDGSTGIYDFSDVANLDHQVSVQKQGHQTILSLTLKDVHVDANSQTIIDPTYDLATSSNYNLRYDGAAANDRIPNGALAAADLDNDGKQDLLVGVRTSNRTRTTNGALYVIYNTLIDNYSSSGNNIDLNTTANYNLRYDGAATGDYLSEDALTTADLDNDGKQDILVGAPGGNGGSGSESGFLYVIYNTLIDDYSGTGNNIDLNTATNYNLRYSGAEGGDYLPNYALTTADLDNDGKQDILVGAPDASNNSRSCSGSLWIIYNTLIDDYSGTGNNINLATATNYNLRYDGAEEDDYLAYEDPSVADLDNDGKQDILVGAAYASNNSRSYSGSLYIIYNTLIDDYSGTANNIDLATATNYNLRYDGAEEDDYLSEVALAAADLDNDGKQDILVGAPDASNNSRSYSGSLYIIYNTLIDDYSGTANNIDLATATNYNLRYDGAEENDYLAYGALTTADLDNDGKQDILVGAAYASNNSRSCSGSLWIIYNTLIDDYSGTANNIDLATATNYNLRYDGAEASDYFPSDEALISADLDNDNKQDILAGTYYADNNSRTTSGSLWIIYNFPHSISVNAVSSPTNSSPVVVTGSVSASNSLTNISGVQYRVDSNSISGSWTACSAADGNFDSKSENFSCSLSGLSDGSHTLYIRAYDAKTAYTAQASYGSTTFTADTTGPTSNANYPFDLLSPKDYSKDSTKPILSFKKSTDATSEVSSYMAELDVGKNRSFSTTGIPTSGNGSASYAWKDDSDVKVEFVNEDDSDSSNDEIRVYFKGLDSSELTEGKHHWRVTAYDTAGNSTSKSQDFYLDKTLPSFSELAIADVSGVAGGGVYKLGDANRTPSFSGQASDSYQGSERTNDDGTKDTFDKVASGPDKLTLTLKKLKEGENPNASDPQYTDHLSQEYSLTDIQDDSDNEKYARFFITTPYPLVDGYYQASLSLKDKAGNTSDHSLFYLSLNYSSPAKASENKQTKLETEIIEEERIPAETEAEKEKVKEEGYTVKVKVVDKNKNPVQGAKVILHSEPREVFTDKNGEAIFEKVEPGEHKILITYQNQTGEQKVNLEGEETKQFDFTIQIKQTNPLTSPSVILLMSISILIMAVLLVLNYQSKKRRNVS
jgi:hypothetical protein